jgi:phosphoglycolate phosphatase
MNPTALVFDFDGTLIDSAPSILECLEHVVREAGLSPRVPIDHGLIGPPLLATLRNITDITAEGELQKLAANFKSRYDGEGLHATRPFPGIQAALETLRARGTPLHLATNKRIRPTRLILEKLGWETLFDSVYAQDMITPVFADKASMLRSLINEQGVDATNALYIGDTVEDGLASTTNAMAFVAVSWGYGDVTSATSRGWRLIHSPSDLADLG